MATDTQRRWYALVLCLMRDATRARYLENDTIRAKALEEAAAHVTNVGQQLGWETDVVALDILASNASQEN